jgi:alpha-mannosidase
VDLVLPVPVAAAPDRASRGTEIVDLPIALEIRVRAGSPVVEGIIHVENRARDHRLRVLFDTGARTVQAHRADSAFAVVERPARKAVPAGTLVEAPVHAAPMQSFVDAGDDTAGALVVADGLVEFEVVYIGSRAATAITLLRCVGALSRDDLATRQGHAGPGLATPGAQCLGPHTFRVAFVPRAHPPSAARLFGIARAFLEPPRLFPSASGDGTVPPRGSFLRLEASPDTLVLSACKPADDRAATVLRLFEAGGQTTSLRATAALPIRAVHIGDLAERREEACAGGRDGVDVIVGPYRITTLVLDLEAG